MVKGFRCIRGDVTFEYCLDECRKRCISRRTAAMFGAFRTLTGNSITQILMPTRMLWLMMTRDFYEQPSSFIDRAIGILGHLKSERMEIPDGLTEERIHTDEDMSGQLDFYDGRECVLYDQKVVGAYKVKKIMEGERDLPWVIQVNYYRMSIEGLGFPVKEMKIEAWVKDPTSIARRMGLPGKVHLFTLPRISDWLINRYIEIKRKRLKEAFNNGYARKCTDRETWNGKRCGWCPVYDVCKSIDKPTKEKT